MGSNPNTTTAQKSLNSRKGAADAGLIIDGLIYRIRKEGPWNVAQAPDGHSLAWHGVFILMNAKLYLDGGVSDPRASGVYTPIFTRNV